MYTEDSKKFDIAKSFKEQLDKFNKTGAGVTPLDENAAVNLHNARLAPPDARLTIPDTWLATLDAWLAPLDPQLTPPLPQLPPPLPQFPLQSPHAASAQPDPASTLYPPFLITPALGAVQSLIWMVTSTSLSVKPQSSARSKKKRTSVADVEDHLSMINGEIQSMHSDMSECRESKNKRYTIKMDYQSQKKEYQWCCESRSHEVLLSAANHQREQEAKDKEILRLQAATAFQEKEAEIWCLKIQYESMKLRGVGGDVAGPSSSSPSI
ncbi:uncharacterized protein EDB91DRAFT_1082316 [Suillus paluster]|uniref:uncharacterized protein n=1 Tax=Suillus paluster TaxID=48578 RepID=UPI001B87781C|nr:uncharacterized protein EDB91DRAFT_1082316 [Suillus paluster]KAG1739952.1 hypothetical protein EDB91DRAFT_1082316 [Suillus paluster]